MSQPHASQSKGRSLTYKTSFLVGGALFAVVTYLLGTFIYQVELLFGGAISSFPSLPSLVDDLWRHHLLTFLPWVVGTTALSGLLGHLLDRQVTLRQAVEAERQRLAALHAIIEAATSTLDIDDLLPRVLQTTVPELGLDAGSLWVFDPDTGAPGARAHHGLSPAFIQEAWEISQAQGPRGLHLTAEGVTVRYSDEQDSPFLALARKEGLVTLFIIPLFADGRRIGSLNLASRHHRVFQPGDMEQFEAVGAQLGLALERARLYHQTELERQRAEAEAQAATQARQQLEAAYLEITRALITALETKDYYTGGHSQRVRQFARQIALEMGLPREEVETISLAAELHDLGKVGVPDRILLKPGPLEPAEWAEIKRHPERSVDILRHLSAFGGLGPVLPIIRAHHERYDGQGYPDNLANGAIPLGARILAVADTYDALTSDRPYRPAFSHEPALAILRENAGSQWDPEVVAAFIASLEKGGAPTPPPPSS